VPFGKLTRAVGVQTWQANYKKRFFNACLAAIVMVAAVAVLRAAGVGIAFDRFLWEARFHCDHRSVSGNIVIVDIDARSLDELGVWPLPRRVFARLTDHLVDEGARDIFFDVDFSAASNPEDDSLLAAAFERAGNVSLAVFRQAASSDGSAGEIINQPIEILEETAWPVVVMVPMESDSRIWRNLFGYSIAGSSEISAAAFLGDYTGATSGSFGLDYSIAADELARVSLVDVLNGTAAPGTFRDRKVIIGASAQELRDLFPVPVFEILPGSVIQALGAETLLQDRAMVVDGEPLAVLCALTIFFLLMMTKIEGWTVKILILALTAFAFELVAFLVQRSIPVLVPTASAHFILMFAAATVVFRELGFHKLLSRLATIGRSNSERMLDHVFDDSFDAIIVLGSDGKITAASQTARSLFASQTLVGQSAQAVLPRELAEEALAVFESGPEMRPVSKVLTLPQENGNRQFIEYVVTRSEKSVVRANRRQDVETQLLACLTCRDVTEERLSAERLEYLARFDPITGLLNRTGFEEELVRKTQVAQRRGECLCLIQFALTNLDQIIASLGFSYGDRVRQAVASRLKSHIAQDAIWSAISADVFAGVFVCDTEQDQDLAMIETIQNFIGEDYTVDGARISVQLNFGYVLAEGDIQPNMLLKNSGNALAKVRRDGVSPVLVFRPEMDEALQRRRTLETELFKAILRDELRMVYQPLVNLADGSVFGAEALLRWEHRQLGPISPAEFIPIAEENGYIVELGAWALNRAMKEALSWSGPLKLSINISAVQFSRGNLVATVAEALERTRFPAERLDLEVTESLFIDESPDLQFCMEELKALGCSFSMDDFGTGYSSLGYITKYPFSKIKLDRSFVRQSITSRQDIAVIEAVLHLARGYGMSVLVEGIETQAQADKLLELGCRLGQGYLFGKPMNAPCFSDLLKTAA